MLTAVRVDKRPAFDNVAENAPYVPDFPDFLELILGRIRVESRAEEAYHAQTGGSYRQF